MLSCAASLGMVMLWNVEEGLNQIDKYFHDGDDFVKSGACLGACTEENVLVLVCCVYCCCCC